MSDAPIRSPSHEASEARGRAVTAIVDMMARGEWDSSSAEAFAKARELSPVTVRQYAGEAGRQLRAMHAIDSEALRAILTARLEKHERAAGDGTREAIQAVSKIADLEGVGVDFRVKADDIIRRFVERFMALLAEKLPPEQYEVALSAYHQATAEMGKTK